MKPASTPTRSPLRQYGGVATTDTKPWLWMNSEDKLEYLTYLDGSTDIPLLLKSKDQVAYCQWKKFL